MAEPFGVKFEIKGPVFDGSGLKAMQGIINRGLLDLATIEGSNHVKDQLYPGHGRITANLRNHIGANLIGDNKAVVDAGATRFGENLIYAARIEGLYHMFANTANAINGNKAALQDKYIGDAVVEAFQ